MPREYVHQLFDLAVSDDAREKMRRIDRIFTRELVEQLMTAPEGHKVFLYPSDRASIGPEPEEGDTVLASTDLGMAPDDIPQYDPDGEWTPDCSVENL